MKYKTLLTSLTLTLLLTGCAKDAVKVPKEVTLSVLEISSSVEIHTEKQKELIFASDPASLIDNTYGKTSLSAPLPVTFSWSETNDLEQAASKYILRINEYGSSDFLEYTTKENSYDVYNLKINILYNYQVISVHSNKKFASETQRFTINQVAPRNIYVEGVENIRDLGGWDIGENKFYRQGKIYRTAQFNRGGPGYDRYESEPTKEGKKTLLNELKIKTEIDLRKTIAFSDQDEVGGITSSPLGSKVKYVSCPMEYGDKNIFTNEKNIDSIKLFFNKLANLNNYPIAFHCMRGTDRTGALAYAIGALVGMSEEDLMLDYLFSDLANIGNPVKATTISGEDFYVQGIASSEGTTLSEKAKNYLHNTCEIEFDVLDAIIDILTEEMIY